MNVKKAEVKKEKEDRLEISKEAQDYQFAMEKLKDIPQIRKDRVEKLKIQVQNGTYQVDSGKIADKILENVQELGRYR